MNGEQVSFLPVVMGPFKTPFASEATPGVDVTAAAAAGVCCCC